MSLAPNLNFQFCLIIWLALQATRRVIRHGEHDMLSVYKYVPGSIQYWIKVKFSIALYYISLNLGSMQNPNTNNNWAIKSSFVILSKKHIDDEINTGEYWNDLNLKLCKSWCHFMSNNRCASFLCIFLFHQNNFFGTHFNNITKIALRGESEHSTFKLWHALVNVWILFWFNFEVNSIAFCNLSSSAGKDWF